MVVGYREQGRIILRWCWGAGNRGASYHGGAGVQRTGAHNTKVVLGYREQGRVIPRWCWGTENRGMLY